MSPDYQLRMKPPPVADYVRLRQAAGLSPKTEEQAAAGLHGGWAACHIIHASVGEVVGMGVCSVTEAGTSTSSTWRSIPNTNGAGSATPS